MSRQFLLVHILFLLVSTCQKLLPVNAEKDDSLKRIARQSGASSNKEFSGPGIYWLSADGPDFQMWPAMGAGYGSGQQQSPMQMGATLGGATGQSNGQQQSATGQQQSAAKGQQPISTSGIQQQQQAQQVVAQQQQQIFSQMQQGFPNAFAGYGQMGAQQQGVGMSGGGTGLSPYAGYLEKQIESYPVMIYTLADCIPCQRAKHLLAVNYPDVRAHYLELSGNEPWQQQLQIDLQYLTGAMTFPYIFVCGQYIGGSTELFELHESGQLRRLVSQCLQKLPPK